MRARRSSTMRAPAASSRSPCPAARVRSSERTGTASSAAAVGVGARRSAAKSISVVSVSWPTAEISGMAEAAAARTTASSLKAQRSSSEPAAARHDQHVRNHLRRQRAHAVNGGGDPLGGALSLHRYRPDQHMAGETLAQPVKDIVQHRTPERGDDADALR